MLLPCLPSGGADGLPSPRTPSPMLSPWQPAACRVGVAAHPRRPRSPPFAHLLQLLAAMLMLTVCLSNAGVDAPAR
uniref:Uncharacterized protein n=1 Tax=Arundo donax TaxID=35708 RepID=A0A0A9G3X4_ARUDO